MEQTQGGVGGLLKKILFRESAKNVRLKPLWSRLHNLSIFAMNYGGGGLIETSGEQWVVSNLVRPILERIESPIVFDVGANVGEYAALVHRLIPSALVYA